MDQRLEFSKKYIEEALPMFQEYARENFSKALGLIEEAYKKDATIYICGNGGSAGTANHMVNDLSKGTSVEGKKRLRVIGLSDNMSLLTALANDCGYETVFVEQLKNLWRHGDVLIGIASSGVHSNGYSLVRHLVDNNGFKYSEKAPFATDKPTLGEALLTPTIIYVKTCLAAAKTGRMLLPER